MATLANIFDRLVTAKAAAGAAPARTSDPDDAFRVRPLANEDVFFFAKRIDNSHVVRQADHRVGRVCWKLIGGSMAAALVVIGIFLPSVYGYFAGYKIEALRQEKQELLSTRALLDLAEAKVMSPERLTRLAHDQKFIDPAPQSVFYLEGKPEVTLASR